MEYDAQSLVAELRVLDRNASGLSVGPDVLHSHAAQRLGDLAAALVNHVARDNLEWWQDKTSEEVRWQLIQQAVKDERRVDALYQLAVLMAHVTK